MAQGISSENFNSYGARRGNHEVMVRGTFANRRLKNHIVHPMEGGYTRTFRKGGPKDSEPVTFYAASQYYREKQVPLVIFAGKEYGTGSSRDWAAKGCLLLNVKAVIAESFERIHRSNLVGMGIMPLQLQQTITTADLALQGDESITLEWPKGDAENVLAPRQTLQLIVRSSHSTLTSAAIERKRSVPVTLRIDNARELAYFLCGGVLPYVANQFSLPLIDKRIF